MGVLYGSVDPQVFANGQAVATPFGTLTAPTTRVAAYVCSLGFQQGWSNDVQTNLVSTLSAALKRCRDGYGDTIYVLPGHVENVVDNSTSLTNLVSGIYIIGIGTGTARPTFTWTNTAGSWLLNQPNVVLQNLVFDMTGAAGVVKGIVVSAAENYILNCDFKVAKTTNYAAIPLELGTGSDRSVVAGCRFRGTVTTPTELINIAGTPDMVMIRDNLFASTSTSGVILNVAAAATSLMITRNEMFQLTAGQYAVTLAAAASSGFLSHNNIYVVNTGTAASSGIQFGAGSVVQTSQNYVTDEVQKSGVLAPAGAS